MDYKFKLSDIVKYILLGAMFIGLVFYSVLCCSDVKLFEIDDEYIKVASDFSFILSAIAIALSYLVGLLIHSFNELFISLYVRLQSRRTRFYTRKFDSTKGVVFNLKILEFNVREICSMVFLKVFARIFVFILKWLFYNDTVASTCNSLVNYGKKRGVYDESIPKWILLSYRPDKMLLVLSEKIASIGGGDSKNEFLYLNEFVLGLRSAFVFMISILSYRVFINGDKADELIIFIAIGVLLCFLFSAFARSFAIKYIKNIDTCIEAEGIDINDLLYKKELPCAYVLIRTTVNRDHLFFDKMVKSVVTQNYPNIKIILQEDTVTKDTSGKTENALQVFNRFKSAMTEGVNNNIKVVYCVDKLGGAAAGSIAIREKFCDIASNTDIAIFLDDDDEFASVNSVSSVMTKMITTDADLCMIGYSVTNELGHSIISNGSKTEYNNLLKDISSQNRTMRFDSVDNMFHAASMGWTKCYRRPILEEYCKIVRECDKSRKLSYEHICNRLPYIVNFNYNKVVSFDFSPYYKYLSFSQLKAYEDFPDYMCLLLKNLKLIAIDDCIYNYNQHKSSITSNLTLDCFNIRRIGFLHYLAECVNMPDSKEKFIDEVNEETLKFIKYKLHIIFGIIENKIAAELSPDYKGEYVFINYSVEKFLEKYNKDRPEWIVEQTIDNIGN